VIVERGPQLKCFATRARVGCRMGCRFYFGLVLFSFTMLGHVAFSRARIIAHITYQPSLLSIIIHFITDNAKSIGYVFIYLYIKNWILSIFT